MTKKMRKPMPFKYSENDLMNLAKQFQHRIDFKRAHPGAYASARNRNLLSTICAHMERLGSKHFRFVYEIFDFPYSYVGLSYDTHVRFKSHKPSVMKLLKRKNVAIYISELLPADQASQLEIELIAKYKQMEGWKNLNVHSGGGLGSIHRVWNTEKAALVLKDKTLDEILETDYGAYQYAKTSVDRDYLFSLIKFKRTRINFTDEQLIELGRGLTMAELQRKDFRAYNYLCRHPKRLEIQKVMNRGVKRSDDGSKLFWTDEKLEDAVRDKSRKEIPAGARRRIANHPNKAYFYSLMKRQKIRWNFELLCERSKGLSPKEFEILYPGGYQAACLHPQKALIFLGMKYQKAK